MRTKPPTDSTINGKPIDDGIKIERVDGNLVEVNTKTRTTRAI